MKGFGIFALALAFNLVGCAPNNPTKSSGRSVPVAVDQPGYLAYANQVGDALKLITAKDWPKAQEALQAVITSKYFSTLPSNVQYDTLRTAAQAYGNHGQLKVGYDYLLRAIAMPQSTVEDRIAQLRVALRLHADSDAVSSLTFIAQKFPDRIATIKTDLVLAAVRAARGEPARGQLALLKALYEAHWKLRWGLEPSKAWRDLVLLLVDKRRLPEAIDVSEHITDVYVLITMRADRRFDTVIASNPAQYDIEAAADREIQMIQSASEGAPRSLELKAQVIRALLNRGRHEAALAASDAVLLDIQSTNYPENLYDDLGTEKSYFLNLRADALEEAGRWDEAVKQLTAASELPEKYGSNVNQIINLADLYCALERPGEALSTLDRMAGKTNAFGAMQLESVRLDAAIQLGDSQQIARSLDYLESHRADAPSAYENALLLVNQLDRAARELVRELLDKNERQDALFSVQIFLSVADPPREMELEARRRATIDRADVQAAVRQVGRIESYPLER